MPDNSTNSRQEPNGFNPKAEGAAYHYYTEREKQIARQAFQAGRDFEASLFKEVLETIVASVKKYRTHTMADQGENDATKP